MVCVGVCPAPALSTPVSTRMSLLPVITACYSPLLLFRAVRVTDKHRAAATGTVSLAQKADTIHLLEVVGALTISELPPSVHQALQPLRYILIVALSIWVEIPVEDASSEVFGETRAKKRRHAVSDRLV